MRTKSIATATLAAVLLAGSAAAVLVAGDAGDPASVAIPSGLVGDQVDYIVRVHERLAPDGSIIDKESHYWFGFRIDGIGTARDGTSALHDAVLVSSTTDRTPTGDGVTHAQHAFALDARVPLEERSGWSGEGFSYGWTSYGPWIEDPYAISSMWGYPTAMMYDLEMDHQGRTLTLGDDLTAADLAGSVAIALAGETTDAWGQAVDQVHATSYSRVVDGVGTIGPYEVVGVVTEMTLEYRRSFRTDDGPYDVRDWEETQRIVTWWNEDVPYPVRVEHTLVRSSSQGSGDGGDVVRDQTVVQDLLAYEPGEAVIGWLPPPTSPYPGADPTLVTGPAGVFHPITGAGEPFPYAFEDALAAVEADPTLLDLQAWRGAHPDSTLVGASFRHDGPAMDVPIWPRLTSAAPAATWSFVYATPGAGGEAFGVETTQYGGAAAASRELGAAPLEERQWFTAADVADELATWTWIADATLAFAAEQDEMPPLYEIGWGYWYTPDVRVNGHASALDTFTASFGLTQAAVGPPDGGVPLDERWGYISFQGTTGRRMGAFHLQYASFYGLGHALDPAEVPPLRQDTRTGASPPPGPGPAFIAAAAASAFAVLMAAYFYPLLKFTATRFFPVIAYTRLQRADVAENAFRERILAQVRDDPGVSPAQLHRRLGGGWSTIVYHIRVLERHELITSTVDGRHRRVFPVGHVGRAGRDQLVALRNARTQEVHRSIDREPGITQAQLSRRLGITERAVHWHLERLKTAELVGTRRDGRRVLYFASPAPPAKPRPPA